MNINPKLANLAVDLTYGYGLVGSIGDYLLEWHRHSTGERSFLSDDAYHCAKQLVEHYEAAIRGGDSDPRKTLLALCPSLRER